MRSSLLAGSFLAASLALSACAGDKITATEGTPEFPTLIATRCADNRLQLVVDGQVTFLIDSLFAGTRRTNMRVLWSSIKTRRAANQSVQAEIDSVSSWTLGDLMAGNIGDPDGAGALTATGASMKLLDLVFGCAGVTPSVVPTPPAGVDAVIQMVTPSETENQTFLSAAGDGAVYIPAGALEGRVMLVMAGSGPAASNVASNTLMAKQSDVAVNTPFPKLSKTVEIALLGGNIRSDKKVTVLFCPLRSDHPAEVLDRAVVAMQEQPVPEGAPIGQGVEYLGPPEGGNLNCVQIASANWRLEKNWMRRRAMQLAYYTERALSLVGPRLLYAANKPIGGATNKGIGSVVIVDPYLETEIVITSSSQTLQYGDATNLAARLRIRDVASNPAVYRGKFVNPDPVTGGNNTLAIGARINSGTPTLKNIDNAGASIWDLPCADAGSHAAVVIFAQTAIPANAPLYGASLATTNVTVVPRDLTVTAANQSRTYGDANPSLSGTLTGVQSHCDDPALITAARSTTATPQSNVGTYPIAADVVFNTSNGDVRAANYNVTRTNGTLTVNPAVLDVSVNNKTREYGVANPVFDGTFTGIRNNDAITMTFSTTATIASAVGTYPIVGQVTGGAGQNYILNSTTNGTLTITPAPLTLSIGNGTRQFADPNPAFTHQLTGARNGDTFDVSIFTAATNLSAVGLYPIDGTVGGTKAVNYTLTKQTGTLTITPRPLTVTTTNASRIYGDPNPAFTGTSNAVGDGLVVSYSSPANATSNVGTYPIQAQVSGPAVANYSPVTVTNGTLTVTAAPLNATANNASRQYGDANPAFTGTVTGAKNGDVITVTVTSSTDAQSPVGIYPLVPSLPPTSSNYFVQSSTNGTLTITPRPLTVTAANASRIYGDANPAFTGTSNAVGGGLVVSYSSPANATSNVGTYPIEAQVSGSALANYSPVTLTNGTLAVTAAPLNATANSASRQYGDANPAFTGTVTGARNGDVITVTVTSSADAQSPVGTYPLVPSLPPTSSNYFVQSSTNGTLTITPRPLTVTAANASRIYGDPNPAFTGTSNAVGGGLVVSYSSPANATSNVGTYPIEAQVSGSALANYSPVTLTSGTLAVTAAPLNATANNANRVYGDPNPAFTGTVTGARNGDVITVTVTSSTNAQSPVGTYPLVPSLPPTSSNYFVQSSTNGTLTITPAPLNATANNASRVYGDPNPAFTGTVTGAKNGDVITVTVTSSTNAQSPVGTYPLVPSLPPASSNYFVQSSTNGTLTITQRELSAVADGDGTDVVREYGDPNPTFTGTITSGSLVPGDGVTLTYTTTATLTSDAGFYLITPTLNGAAASNYAFTGTEGFLTVSTAPINLVANNTTRTYGNTTPAFTGSITGAKNGDLLVVVVRSNPIVNATTPAGTTTSLEPRTAEAYNNYHIASETNGVLNIVQRPLTGTVDNKTMTQGQAVPALTGTVSGAVNGFVVTYSTTATSGSPAGTYPITVNLSVAGGSNYVWQGTNGVLTINP